MPRARSDNNYVIGDRHITRTALTLHTAVPQSYNKLGHFVVPHSGMDVIHTVDGTMVDVQGKIVPLSGPLHPLAIDAVLLPGSKPVG